MMKKYGIEIESKNRVKKKGGQIGKSSVDIMIEKEKGTRTGTCKTLP
jgi:hypothetical protein